jgi:hypothetical protein
MSDRPPRPPKGPIRKAYTAVYALFCIALMSSISLQVTWYVLFDGAEAEARVAKGTDAASVDGKQCGQDLHALYQDLKTRGDSAMASADAPQTAKEQWHTFAMDWQRRMTALSARCRFRSGGMKPLRKLAKDLERLEAAYSTAIDGFTQIGQKPHARLQAGFAAILK